MPLFTVRSRWFLIVVSIGLCAAPAAAFNSEVHKDFYDFAFPEGIAAPNPIDPPSLEALGDYRRFVFELASADPDFRKRWPRSEDFTPDAFKEFLSLNPLKTVIGIDSVPYDRGRDHRTVVREASVDPDKDQRNRDRLHLLPDRTVALDPEGRAVPADPRTVWFSGVLVGAASQFDAHGATLRHGRKGQWLVTTLGRPEQYAKPKVPLGSTPEFSQSYAELAMIARLWGGDGAEWLALTYAGNSLHGIEDLGNQIHATLIGSHQFYVDTLRAYISSCFNPLAELPDDEAERFRPPERLTIAELNEALERLDDQDSIDPQTRFALRLEPTGKPGVRAIAGMILGSHHRLLEAYMQDLYLEGRAAIRAGEPERADPAAVALFAAAAEGDAEFREHAEAVLSDAGLGQTEPGTTPFALILGEQLIDRSAPEAAPMYESIRAIAINPLRQARKEYRDGQPVLNFIRPEFKGENADNRHTRRLWQLSRDSFARVVTAIRLWFEAFESESGGVAPGSPEAIERAQRLGLQLASRQMAMMREAAERREVYLAEKGGG